MLGRNAVVLSFLSVGLWMLAGLSAGQHPEPGGGEKGEGTSKTKSGVSLSEPVALPRREEKGEATKAEADPVSKRLANLEESLGFVESGLTKKVEDLLLFRRLEDVAVVDKVRYTGPPPRVVKNPTGQGAGNPIIINAYTFLPRKPQGKLPLVILVHGGVHGDFNSNNVHVLRELLEQGYAVLAPEYRGSSGYGKDFWQLIDYGGLETEEVFGGREWMLENNEKIDGKRVGNLGLSHRG